MPSLAATIASDTKSGYVIAPAGYGKTYLIAEAVSFAASRQLILTHTYAGVNALRVKLRQLGVSTRLFRLDTIASWSLRLALAFRENSGWDVEVPEGDDWAALYRATASLVQRNFIVRMLQASYGAVYIDEYQDCSEAQHRLVLNLAKALPVRIVGDPMQGIFDFDGDPIAWSRDVEGHFPPLGSLETPYRWIKSGNPELGTWLKTLRENLEQGKATSLTSGLPRGIDVRFANDSVEMARKQISACRFLNCEDAESAVVIFGGGPEAKNRSHGLARRVGGRFSSIEEIEGKSLFGAVKKIENATSNQGRLRALIDFAESSLTNVTSNLSAATQRGDLATIRPNTRNPALTTLANAYLIDALPSTAMRFLLCLREADGVGVARGDLFNRMVSVLRKQAVNAGMLLSDAANKYHTEFRYSGRPVGRRIIGTTLLVKGLQFDHAIVMDAAVLPMKDAYVALTRGARSLTILSTKTELTFPQPTPWTL